MKGDSIKLAISTVKKPIKNDLNYEIQAFSDCLGLFTHRDKEKSCFRVFIELLKNSKKGKAMSSDELAYKTNLSRGTVVHHLNRLIASDLVVHSKNKYILKEPSLAELVTNLQRDANAIFSELLVLAKDLDEKLE